MAAEKESGRSEIRNAELTNGDPDVMGQVFQEQYLNLVGLATRLIGNRDDAEDLVQDVVTGMWKNRANLRPEVLSSTYLVGAVIRRSMGYRRAAAVRRISPVEPGSSVLSPQASLGVDPVEAVMGIDGAKQMLSGLTERQKQVVVLLDILGYSVLDAASVLGTAKGTIQSSASRGRAKIKENVAKNRNQ